LPGRNLIPTGHARSGHRPRTERTPSISSQPVPPHQSRPVWQTSPDRAPVRESVRTGPRPRRLSSPTLDHAFGGSSTLDSRPWTCWKVSRLATTVSGRRRAPRTTPPQAGFPQPTAPSVGQRTPSFYASGNNSVNCRRETRTPPAGRPSTQDRTMHRKLRREERHSRCHAA
jgi:hypothetical protein